MTLSSPISLTGCRHDVLGHALKAIGVLRAISECGAPEDRDPSAEGWWNLNNGAFMIRSARYPDLESLVTFFAESYRPTPIIAAWNKSGGVTDKIEVTISCQAGDVAAFRSNHEAALERFGLKKTKKLSKAGALVFTLTDSINLAELQRIAVAAGLACSSKEKRSRGQVATEVTIGAGTGPLEQFRAEQAERLADLGFGPKKGLSTAGQLKFSTASSNRFEAERLVAEFNAALLRRSDASDADTITDAEPPNGPLQVTIIAKESGKKDGTLPSVQKLLKGDATFSECLALARQWGDELQGRGERGMATDAALVRYRDYLPEAVAEAFDALATVHLSRHNNNPLFVNRGQQGSTDVFLMSWGHFISFRDHPGSYARASLFGERLVGNVRSAPQVKGKGAPFFPDAIKNYNQGLEWVTEMFPFCPLDYLLAVEGALAMRGAVSKSLGALSRSFATFPFVFEGAATMTDDQGEVTGLGASLWLPIWSRPTTFGELQSFILDSQARLPGKECRYSSDFARAIRAQGVDAGFDAFQEFRFKMKGARVPWAVSSRYVVTSGTASASVLNELLAPIDASGFLDQFRFRTPKEAKRDRKPDLHPLRAPVLEAVEAAASEPDASKVVDVLCRLADLNGQLARSKSLREKVGAGPVTFVPPLRCGNWSAALRDLECDPEFEVATALASIRGREQQPDGKFSDAEPFLGSLLPLRRTENAWYLPDPPSPQAVWSGLDLTRDLAAVLARRILDSAKDAWPAVMGVWTASLSTILRFLRGELDDRRIASLVEALSLIDWRYEPRRPDTDDTVGSLDEGLDPVPIAYAAVRSLLEVACQPQPHEGRDAKERSGPRIDVQRAVALLCRREPGMVTAATIDALRRLAVVGVPNTFGEDSRREKPRLAGRDVIAVGTTFASGAQLSRRLAAAVLIPLDARDTWKLFRAITLPQTLR